MGILEKIKEIEAEIARTQKNKATEHHLGGLKAKLAKLRTELLDPAGSKPGAKGEGFDVAKTGAARVALIGFPSVGKSTLLSTLTETESEQAAQEFTTLTCIPGNIYYKGVKIQMLDLPGIIEGAAYGKGRGRQVIAVAKSADLILMVLDAAKEHEKNHRAILERELESVGLRLNRSPPDIYFRRKATGGVKFNHTVPLTRLGDDPAHTVNRILHEYRIHNAELVLREDVGTDDLIDVIEGNRKYIKCLYVYNKADTVTIEDVDSLARNPSSVVCSVMQEWNLDYVLKRMWETMGIVRVYTKPRGEAPDLEEPVALTEDRHGCNIEALCRQIHKDLLRDFNYALVWGASTKHNPQRCGLQHDLGDEDVVQIVKRTVQQQRKDKSYANRCQAAFDHYKDKKKKKKKPLKS